jgi:hypothetical protein
LGSRAQVPKSFAFGSRTGIEEATATESSEKPTMSHGTGTKEDVDVFVTVAGRDRGTGSHTSRTTIEELERVVPVTLIRDVLPVEFADHTSGVHGRNEALAHVEALVV